MLKPADLTKMMHECASRDHALRQTVFPRRSETLPAGKNREGEPQFQVLDRGPVYKADQLVAREVLCAVTGFACCELNNGFFACWWPGHVDVAETWEEMYNVLLNGHEKLMVDMRVNNAEPYKY